MPTPRSFKWSTNLAKKEAVFGVQMADADLTQWFAPTAADFAELTYGIRTNEDEINGFAGATESEVESKEGAVARKFQASVETITAFIAWMLGNVTSVGAGDPWTHTIKWPNICTLNMPSFSFIEMLDCVGATNTFLLYKGCVVDQIIVDVKGRQFVELTVNIKTDGSETAKPSFTPPAAIVTVKKLIGANWTLKHGELGTEDLTSVLRAFKFTLNAGIVIPDSSTSEALVQEYQYGDKRPTIEVEYTIKGDKSHDIYDLFTNHTTAILDFSLDPVVTPARSINLHMTATKIDKATVKPQGSETQIDVTVGARHNLTDVGPAVFTAKTGNAAYLVASP